MVGDNGKSGTAEAATLADVAPFRQRNSHGQAIVSLYHNSTIGDALRVCTTLLLCPFAKELAQASAHIRHLQTAVQLAMLSSYTFQPLQGRVCAP